MSDAGEQRSPDVDGSASPEEARVFLVVVDDSAEMSVALRFAARRAEHTGGRVALLYVTEPADFQHWMSVGDLMREEARQEAENVLKRHSEAVQGICGKMPMLYVREGDRAEQLLQLIDEETSISIVVLAAGTGREGPGPIISSLVGKRAGQLRTPLTIVPGHLSAEEIDALT